MCVFVCFVLYHHQQTGQPMSLRRAIFLRAFGAAVSDGIGFRRPSYWIFAGYALLPWIVSSSLFLTDSDLPGRSSLPLLDVSGSSCGLFVSWFFQIRHQSLKRPHYINSLHLPLRAAFIWTEQLATSDLDVLKL
ncbi:hypothetical protein CHARACLAT_029045 [Characodon lateralis]|uniref:Uncharacterized protein n=1 Tax=Characodon lateralis TaxID=208331 RepID=A0ABU7E4H5_9TELE|nr:hypothetical protein [Characodon lateralis]